MQQMNEHLELEPFAMRIERHAHSVFVRLFGEFDHSTRGAFEEHVDELLLRRARAQRLRRLVFDLRGVTFMDSTGIQLLLDTQKRCRAKECDMALLPNRSRQVRELIGITRLEEVFDVIEVGVEAPDGPILA
jgi:anti-anti-sigma factor